MRNRSPGWEQKAVTELSKRLRTPQMGKLHINYLFDAQIQTADQSLQHPAADVKDIKGFDWKNTPIRTAFSHRHKLDIGGGDRYVKYNFSVEGDPSGKGVMKDDYHKTLGLSNYISYRRSIFSISNHLSFYQTKIMPAHTGLMTITRICLLNCRPTMQTAKQQLSSAMER